MGWASGSEMLRGIVNVINEEDIDDDIKSNIYEQIVEIFEDFDCDTLDEVEGIDPIMDEILIERGWLEDGEESEEEEDEE